MVHMEPELKESARALLTGNAEKKSGFGSSGWKKAAAALCMLVLVLAGYGGHVFLKPVSVISIDINPSIELGINAFDRVVSVDAYNDDGEAQMQKLSLRFLKSLDAVNTVLCSDIIQSHLSGEESLTLTVVGENEADSEALFLRLEDSVGSAENVFCHSASSHMVENAHHCGLSYGKYLAYLEALKENPGLKPEDVQEMTMSQIKALSGDHCDHENSPMETMEHHTLETETTLPAEGTHHQHGKKTHKSDHH